MSEADGIMKYKAVIYDCDGVLFDSFEANFAFYSGILSAMGLEPPDRSDTELMRVLHTLSSREVFAHMFPPGELREEAMLRMSEVDYRPLVPLMVPEVDLFETLERLKGTVALAICTNRSLSMDLVMDHFGLRRYFDRVMTACRVARPKPYPDPLLALLDELRLPPGEVLFVGDSDVDRQAAEAASVPFAAFRQDLPALARLESHADIFRLLQGA